jgi:hypothetical protein
MGIIKEGSKEDECGWYTFYTRFNIGSIHLSLFCWGFMKDFKGLGGGWTLAFLPGKMRTMWPAPAIDDVLYVLTFT